LTADKGKIIEHKEKKMNETEGIRQLLRRILTSQRFAVLCSIDDRQPYSNLIAFAVSDDLKHLVFVTNRNTRKYRNIIGNKEVSLLVDNRTNQTTDVNTATAITILGSAVEMVDKNQRFISIYQAKHADLNSFVNEPENALIIVAVSEYIVADFNKVKRIVVKS